MLKGLERVLGSIPFWMKPLKDVRANCFWASLRRMRITCHIMPHHASSAHARYKNEQMIRQMAIATALLGFNDLGRSVTPSFRFRNRFYLQLSTHCPKMNKNQCGKLKKFQDFCPRNMKSCHLEPARHMKLWSLNANLFFEEPHQLTKFA